MKDISCALELRDIHKSFGKREVLKGISLSADTGDVVSILGRSGSGKSTLLRCINFLETPDAGFVSVCGTKITVPAQDKEKKNSAVQRRFWRFAEKSAWCSSPLTSGTI
nr:ATP-binding cassette domain-containing protein [uncultured Desulfobacter sp.]